MYTIRQVYVRSFTQYNFVCVIIVVMIMKKVYARNVEKHVLLNNIVDIELSRWLSLIILIVLLKN